MIISDKVINDYIELHEKIDKFFDEARIERKYYIQAIGMSRPTFNRKIKNKTMLPNEMRALVDKINQLKA